MADARVVILGCGYIGIELGRQLTEAGHDVVGVRRSEEGCAAIEDAGFASHRADLTDPDDVEALPAGDWLVFAASSGGRDAEAARRIYVDALADVIEEYGERESPPDRLVYTSSTGVYGDHDGAWVDESTPLEPTTEKTEVLVEAERIAREESAEYGIDGTVARFSGLYGPDRYRLERYIEGPVTEGYLNMVHREDAAGAVAYLLLQERARDEAVLVTDDEPVDKWTFADWLADECGLDSPPKRTKQERLTDDGLSAAARRRILTSKRCSNEKLRELGYSLRYPTFREGYRAAVDAYRNRTAK
ncbi:SDR family oxidoreductase [Halohasta litorea]|uniref:SDR family oxidoreductase n=1 Tax=Halohasta litorea TaxID=869891 RepID=A0ABD6D3F1_9EURY|nr:SDR family oxidoreductase [Halohasta litorea]